MRLMAETTPLERAAHEAWLRQGGNGAGWKEILDEATSGDYDHLLQTLVKNFDVQMDDEWDDDDEEDGEW